jgi:chromosome segregation protein
MTHTVGFHPGAIWRKTDFQVHTPRDAQWGGASFDGSSQAGRDGRVAWAKDLIRSAIAKNISCIAITDHHDVAFSPSVKQALQELHAAGEAPGFWLFTGMEVTCDDNCQCLLIFDADVGHVELDRLYGGLLKNVVKIDETLERMPQNSLCGHDISVFWSAVTEDPVLGQRLILLPHGGDPGSSHKSIMQNGFQSRFRDLPFDGVYIEKPYASVGYKTKQKIEGGFAEWGTRRRGVISTGDNRLANFDDLGSNPCWVRLGEPTAESIRQALLADEARIAYAEPVLPSHRITQVEVSSALSGPGFKLYLNDGFNAVIGGRGSGKSALLEYLRFGLGRSVFEGAGAVENGDRVQKLLTDTLAGGFVRVTLVRGEIEETWHRTLAKRNVIQVSRADGSSEEISIEVAQQRFPARGYHQKELSSVVSSKRSAADQITGIAAAELVAERRDNDSKREAATLEVTTTFQQLVEFWSAEAADERAKSSVEDLKRRIAAHQARLKEAGLSEETQKILALAPEYARATAYATSVVAGIGGTKKALQALLVNLYGAVVAPKVPADADFDEIRAMIGDVGDDTEKAKAAAAAMVAEMDALSLRVVARQTAFAEVERNFQIRLAGAMAEQQQHKALLDEAALLNAQLEAAEAGARQAAERLKEREQAPIAFDKSRERVAAILSDRRDLLKRAADQTGAMSDGLLKASVVPAIVSDDQVSALCAMIESSRIRSPEEKVKAHLTVIAADPVAWDKFCNQLLSISRAKTRSPASAAEAPALDADTSAELDAVLSFETLTDFARQTIWTKFSPATLTAILAAAPDAYVEFEFKDHDGSYIPFERASPGQQASALLTLLLKQKAGTLLIDQPEDDLDNRVVMQIAKLLRTTKTNRQLIFATHNPNFVVNGDADKVVVMNSGAPNLAGGSAAPRVSMLVDGAIETPAVREAITEIMEGGKEAFELRSRKYFFAR